jgi:hypothetical protein
MSLQSRHRKLVCLAALGLGVVAACFWRAYDAHRRSAVVEAARRLGGRVNSLPFLWTEELRIHFDNALEPEAMCRELATLNHAGLFRSVAVAVHARNVSPEKIAHLRECLDRCSVICIEDAP